MNKYLLILGVFLASAFATEFFTYTYYSEFLCKGTSHAYGFQPVGECVYQSKNTCKDNGILYTSYSDSDCTKSVSTYTFTKEDCSIFNYKITDCGKSFDESLNQVEGGVWLVSYENDDCTGNIVSGFGIAENVCWRMGDTAYYTLTIDGDTVTQHNCTDSVCKNCTLGESQTFGSCVDNGIKLYHSDAMTLSVSMLVLFLAAILLLH